MERAENANKKHTSGILLSIFFVTLTYILILIHLLPNNIKSIFVLDVNNPTLVSIYLNHFVHKDSFHLQSNMIGLLILITTLYFLVILFKMYEKEKEIVKILITDLLTAPFLISIIFISAWYIMRTFSIDLGDAYLVGFSGILASFYSLILFIVFSMVTNLPFSVIFYFFSSVLLIFIYTYFTTFIGSFPLVLKLLYLLSIPLPVCLFIYSIKKISSYSSFIKKNRLRLTAIVIIPFIELIWLFIPFFPQNPNRIGIHIHFIGIFYGVFWYYIYWRLTKFKGMLNKH